MYKIVMDKMCGCAKKDDKLNHWLNRTYESKEEAEFEALRLANHANANWCKKHRFYAVEEDNTLRIMVELSCPKEV